MLRKLLPRSIYDVMAAIGCFVALATGTAYAANTVFSPDIVDGEVKSVDVGDGEIKSADVKDQSLTTFDVSTFLGADVVDGTLTGADVGDESLTGADIANGSLQLGDVGFDAITTFQVLDFTLNDEDVGEATLHNVAVDIGVLTATSCVNRSAGDLGANGDHALLTPSADDAHGALMYDARYNSSGGTVTIHVCNFSSATINDGITHFNVLTFDAQ